MSWYYLFTRMDQGQTILIHCSAGIHRTGMLAYSLLRWRGLDDTEAMQILMKARRFTGARGFIQICPATCF